MAFADLTNSELSIRVCEAGEIVTTRPGVVHNVYLPAGSVIHTVKHGNAAGSDRRTDDRTTAFDLVTHAFRGNADVRAQAIRKSQTARYGEEYRHFDNLIWQVPAWSTAIFALSVQGLLEVLDATGDWKRPAALILSLVTGMCLLCFSFVMMRFRTHQWKLKDYKATPAWLSAATVTQTLITIEAAVLIGAALVAAEIGNRLSAILAVSIAIILTILFERSVRRRSVKR